MWTNINITDLRSSIFDNIEQQESGDFLRNLLECRSLAGIKQLLVHKLVKSIKCSNCDYRQNIRRTENVIAQLCIPKDRKRSIYEVISFNYRNWKNIQDSECAHCGYYLKHQSLIQDTGCVLVFSVSLFDSANRKINNFNLTNASQTELRFENKTYSLSSAIFHHGNVFNERHNTFVLKKDREFYKAKDTIISKCSWPRNSKDV